MTLISFCGKFALYFACAIILLVIVIGLLAIFCLGLGAYDSYSNPHALHDEQVEYRNASQDIGTGVVGLNRAVNNVTGGG